MADLEISTHLSRGEFITKVLNDAWHQLQKVIDQLDIESEPRAIAEMLQCDLDVLEETLRKQCVGVVLLAEPLPGQ